MPRKPRNLQAGYSYHVTTRCNNREFKLSKRECREVFLYAIKKALDKHQFKLYALCIMSNHVHYLIEPAQPEDLPKIMHFLNWYTAMCFNRMLRRTGHFWEKRYFCDGFPPSDRERALNTLRYIHGNPKAAKMRSGFFYDFSNYGSYERLTDDGLTQWHPAFLKLGDSLEECARKYKGFCQKYKPKEKNTATRCHWGSKLLAGVHLPESKSSSTREPRKRETTEEQTPVLPRSLSPLLSVPGIRKPCFN
ncbi:transposase [Microcystis aeruginosa CS-338/01]|uniref:transposase n=1 Tax=Microcystis aeruginosa TaxID=1126 RepID=UPI00232D6411|nr:transposase [Microcystis aeruginosa]MDB9508862.1 transposase [Microcystis aeruginosa CS-338/01]